MASAVGFNNSSILTMNDSSSGNSSFSSSQQTCNRNEPDSSAVITVKTCILCGIMIAALVGNVGIILIVFKTKTLRRAVNFFIVNMAIADCLIATFAIPHHIVPIATRSYQWRVSGAAGLALCKIVFIVIDTASVVSMLSMVCLACDRFCAVVKPMNRSLITSAIRKGGIILTWILALGYSSPYLYTVKMSSFKGMSFCYVNWGSNHIEAATIHVTVLISVFGILPWILVIILYATMIVEIKKSKRASQPNLHNSSHKGNIDMKVIKLSLAIVVSFAVCYFPMMAMYFIVAFVWKWSTLVCRPSYWPNLFFAAQAVVFLYTVLNPCVCFIFSENFRKGYKDLLSLRRRESSLVDALSLTSRHRPSKTTFVENNQNPSYIELSAENSVSLRMDLIEK